MTTNEFRHQKRRAPRRTGRLLATGLTALLAPGLLASACEGQKAPKRHFDAPLSVAIGPYGEDADPWAFVADASNLAVRRIDLRARKVVEPALPVGRPLTALALHVGPAGVVDRVWGVDRRNGALVHLDPVDALSPVAGTVTFTDAGPASAVDLDGLQVESGRTSTQTWTVTYREGLDRWEIVASGAGPQRELPRTGESFRSDEGEVRFRVVRTGDAPPTEGDTFTFQTENGVQVAAFLTTGGAMNVVRVDDDHGVVSTVEPARLVAFHLDTGAEVASFSLPAGAIPGGMEVAPGGNALWVADLGNPLLHRLDTTGDPSAWTLSNRPIAVAARDVAVSGDDLRVFAMAADAADVFVYALPDWTPVDFTGATLGADPVPFRAATRAMAGARLPHVMRGTGIPSYPVLLTTHAGNLFAMHGGTGCIDFADPRGPRLQGVRFRNSATQSAPIFNDEAFEANRCGGVVRNETWTLVYDGLLGAWEVSGNVSGPQTGLLFEDLPYTTDRGEITMLIESNEEFPTDDGDTFFVSVIDGIAALPVGLVPGRPVFFTLDVDGTPVEYALVPNAAGDTLTQVDVGERRVRATYR